MNLERLEELGLTDQDRKRIAARLRGEPHRHHEGCIHNLPPDEQVEMRGWTREQWVALHGAMPVQITPDDWVDPQ